MDEIRNKGCVVIRDVVDDAEARTWQAWLRDYVTKNPVDGKPFALLLVLAIVYGGAKQETPVCIARFPGGR